MSYYLYWVAYAICSSLPTLVCILLHCSQWLPASTCTCSTVTLTWSESLVRRPRMIQNRRSNLVNWLLPQQHAVPSTATCHQDCRLLIENRSSTMASDYHDLTITTSLQFLDNWKMVCTGSWRAWGRKSDSP